MNQKKNFPSRNELDQAYHMLQDQITRISVKEEEEMIEEEIVKRGKFE
ncbi:MAG: hypothetical protein Q8934_00835 [Bacillota bacterium]|nr:hypothetical protein [Bacillota bacterium]